MTTASEPRLRPAESSELERWDDIVRGFANHRVTHTRAWMESLRAAGHGEPQFLVFERDGDVVGALPGLLATVGRWRVFGSPMAGCQTISLGPAHDPSRISTAEMMRTLVPYLENEHRVAHIELLHLGLDADAMRASGFEGEPVPTQVAPLFPGDEAKALKAMKDSARRNIKRAQRLGLVVKVEEDERFVDDHYAQLREVYHRRGTTIPFSAERIRVCFRHLRDTGNLLALGVYLPGGKINIATGTFFIEGNELSLWMWAHHLHYRWYRPTELMTWTAMQRAMERGCDHFDFMGRGDFKEKLGASPDETKWRWQRSNPRWLMVARRTAGKVFYAQQAVRGRALHLAAQARATLSPSAIVARRREAAKAWVIGDVDLVRALGLAGIPSIAVAAPGSAARYSRFTRGVVDWAGPSSPTAEAVVDGLVNQALRMPEPPVLFYEDDGSMLLVSRFRQRLREAFRFIVPDAALVEQLADKARFQTLAAQLRLPVPPAWMISAGEPLPEAALAARFPMIVKPISRQLAGWKPIARGAKAIRVESPDALAQLWSQLSAGGVSVLAQTLVEGPETAIESYHTYTDERGVVAEFTGRKIRTFPTTFGDSAAVEITDAQDVAAVGRDIVARLRLRGVAKLDFKRGPDGLLYLLEINPRFTLWHHPGAVAGVNIPALVYGDLLGQPRPSVVPARAGVQWSKVWTDRAAARESGLSMGQWLGWLARCDSLSAFAWDDPLPIARAAAWQWRHRTGASHTAPVSEPQDAPSGFGPAVNLDLAARGPR